MKCERVCGNPHEELVPFARVGPASKARVTLRMSDTAGGVGANTTPVGNLSRSTQFRPLSDVDRSAVLRSDWSNGRDGL